MLSAHHHHQPSLARSAVLCAALLTLLSVTGCGKDTPVRRKATPTTPHVATNGVTYRSVREHMGIPFGDGPLRRANSERIPCATCHSMLEPNPAQRGGKTLERFHQGVQIQHGGLTCLSCHDANDYQALRLADGRSIPVGDAHQLCAQCHGTQARAYEHGAHGGMTGAWDARQGTQVRNRCTHCHAPHAPAFPSMWPTFKPRDRFLNPARGHRDE